MNHHHPLISEHPTKTFTPAKHREGAWYALQGKVLRVMESESTSRTGRGTQEADAAPEKSGTLGGRVKKLLRRFARK